LRKKEHFLKLLKDIKDARHVLIIVKDDIFLPSASALYTYVLQLHKKVSLVCLCKEVDEKFSFLPWFEKIRESAPSSADFVVELDEEIFDLYDFFEINGVKINQKISTALYASILIRYDGFTSKNIDAKIFMDASKLLSYGADHKRCVEVLNRTTLARLRLKSIMLRKMLLKDGAKEAFFSLDEDDLKSSGATLSDAKLIIKEALKLEYVQKVILVKDTKVIKSIRKEI